MTNARTEVPLGAMNAGACTVATVTPPTTKVTTAVFGVNPPPVMLTVVPPPCGPECGVIELRESGVVPLGAPEPLPAPVGPLFEGGNGDGVGCGEGVGDGFGGGAVKTPGAGPMLVPPPPPPHPTSMRPTVATATRELNSRDIFPVPSCLPVAGRPAPELSLTESAREAPADNRVAALHELTGRIRPPHPTALQRDEDSELRGMPQVSPGLRANIRGKTGSRRVPCSSLAYLRVILAKYSGTYPCHSRSLRSCRRTLGVSCRVLSAPRKSPSLGLPSVPSPLAPGGKSAFE